MNGTWVRIATASKHFGVHQSTLRRWDTDGLVECKRTAGGQRVYRIDSGSPDKFDATAKHSYIYVRVSSAKQKDDLERQSAFLQAKYPTFRVVKDIGSGLNFKRKGLLKLMEQSSKGLIEKVVVASKDRLCRFGFDLIFWHFQQNNTELLVLDKSDKTPEQEFTEDILAVLQVFACRWNGRRKYTVTDQKSKNTVHVTSEEASAYVE